jgi:hypothetical protein
LDDGGDLGPEPGADAVEHGRPAAVLDGVVEERGDRLVLVAAVFEHESGDDEQVRGVRDLRSETAVPAVRLV